MGGQVEWRKWNGNREESMYRERQAIVLKRKWKTCLCATAPPKLYAAALRPIIKLSTLSSSLSCLFNSPYIYISDHSLSWCFLFFKKLEVKPYEKFFCFTICNYVKRFGTCRIQYQVNSIFLPFFLFLFFRAKNIHICKLIFSFNILVWRYYIAVFFSLPKSK